MNKPLKEIIAERYGSVDNFIAETGIDISRVYLYNLLNSQDANPTISAIMKIARALQMDPLDIASEYSTRHRDFWTSNK